MADSDLPSMAGPVGTPRASRIVGARSSRFAPSPRNGRFIEQDARHERGVDDVVAAPLLDVVLEVPLGHAAERRCPGDAIARREVDDQVGRLAGERAVSRAPRGS